MPRTALILVAALFAALILPAQANSNRGTRSEIVAGQNNTIDRGAANSTIAGGNRNRINRNGKQAIVAGGQNNLAGGTAAFAAGNKAQARHSGTFVWGDGQSPIFGSTAANQFLIRAQRGVGINTNNPRGNALSVRGNTLLTGNLQVTGNINGQFNTGTFTDLTVTGKLLSGSGNTSSGAFGTIGGGQSNNVSASATNAVIAGGYKNYAHARLATVSGGAENQAHELATVGGGAANEATDYAATVGGGVGNNATKRNATVGGGYSNLADATNATVSGGYNNISFAEGGFIGGGQSNSIVAAGIRSVIGGGWQNQVTGKEHNTVGGGWQNTASGELTFIGGGWNNTAGGDYATVGGGRENTASGENATVGGGETNRATGSSTTIGGGIDNTATISYATVGGGEGNDATGNNSTVGGGYNNTASGLYATVPGGALANASQDGSFVWSGDPNEVTSSFGAGTFTVRCEGGARFYTANGVGAGAWLKAGLNSWDTLSDSNAKTKISTVNPRAVLAKLAVLPVTEWEYTSAPHRRFFGPMAQDFHAAFGLGDDDKTINTLDADGVLFLSVKGLVEELKERDRAMAARDKTIEDLKSKLHAVEERLDSLPPAP